MIKFSEFTVTSEIVSQIKLALTKYSESSILWKLYLTTMIQQADESNDCENEVIIFFYKAIASVTQKSAVDLWKLVVNWCLMKSHKCAEKILREGSQEMNKEISSYCRLKYLHWSIHEPITNDKQKSSLARVRKIYERFF